MPQVRSNISPQDVDELITLACRAPSVHNTQPWRFRFAHGVVELRVDPVRQLLVADLTGRELVISCGAAVTNLELGIRGLGLEPRVRLLPMAADPLLLATVRGMPGAAPARAELRMLAAIHRRHSHRGRFAASGPPPALLAELRQAARSHGARLVVIPEGPTAEALLRLAWSAEARQRDGNARSAEVLAWAAVPGSHRRDGVPRRAYPDQLAAPEPGALPGRDFAGGRGWGTGDPAGTGGSVLAVLLTDGDLTADWLRAGRALQYVLLRATCEWVFASFATQPLELPDVRQALQQACPGIGIPQMLFRLGCSGTSAQTPRRPVSAVLTFD